MKDTFNDSRLLERLNKLFESNNKYYIILIDSQNLQNKGKENVKEIENQKEKEKTKEKQKEKEKVKEIKNNESVELNVYNKDININR